MGPRNECLDVCILRQVEIIIKIIIGPQIRISRGDPIARVVAFPELLEMISPRRKESAGHGGIYIGVAAAVGRFIETSLQQELLSRRIQHLSGLPSLQIAEVDIMGESDVAEENPARQFLIVEETLDIAIQGQVGVAIKSQAFFFGEIQVADAPLLETVFHVVIRHR